MHGIGVDIEDGTRDPGATGLARKYYSVAEARVVEGEEGQVDLRSFFQFWCLKEAALKSIGQGLPFGLNAFGFELEPSLRAVLTPPGFGGPDRFSAHFLEGIEGIDGTECCAAVVIHGS
ncbi:MAG: 4'-phosphopantetheinyl transferase superfamily protein [Halioglobus sp.]